MNHWFHLRISNISLKWKKKLPVFRMISPWPPVQTNTSIGISIMGVESRGHFQRSQRGTYPLGKSWKSYHLLIMWLKNSLSKWLSGERQWAEASQESRESRGLWHSVTFWSKLTNESRGIATFDSSCTAQVLVRRKKVWFDDYMHSIKDNAKSEVRISLSNAVIAFDGDERCTVKLEAYISVNWEPKLFTESSCYKPILDLSTLTLSNLTMWLVLAKKHCQLKMFPKFCWWWPPQALNNERQD